MLWQEWSKQRLNAVGNLLRISLLKLCRVQRRALLRRRGRADVAKFAGSIGGAYRHACGIAVDRRLVSANAPSDVRQSASHR